MGIFFFDGIVKMHYISALINPVKTGFLHDGEKSWKKGRGWVKVYRFIWVSLIMRNFQLVIVMLFLSFLFIEGKAQPHVLDSLRKEIEKHQEPDSVRVEAIMDYAIAALNNNTSDFLPYMNEILAISRKTNNRRGLQRGFMIGQIYFSDRAQYEKAFLYSDSAFAVLKGDTSWSARGNTGNLYNNVAGDYFKLGDYDKAVENYTNSARIFEPMDHPFLASVYGNLAEVHEKMYQQEKTIEYHRKAIAAAEKSGIERSISMRRLNYSIMLINKEKFAEAAEVMKTAEPLVMKLQNNFLLMQFYYNMGFINKADKNYKTSVANYRKALELATLGEDIHKKTDILDGLADCLIDMNRLSDAKMYIDTLLLLTKKHSLKPARRNTYVNLAKWHAKGGNYKEANAWLQNTMNLNDSILSDENREKVAALEVRYSVEKKVQEINQLKAEAEVQLLTITQKNTLNYILIGGAVTLLVISLLSFGSYKQKQKLQQQRISELETEKQLTATEAVLKGEDQERTRLAKDLHDGLGGMLSGIKHSFNTMKGNLIMTPENHQAFERSMDMLDSSIKEMRRVAHNMMPEALVRFGLDTALRDYCQDINQSGALQINYQSIGAVDENLDQTTAIAIYRIVQELITNTMKHAAAKITIVQLTKTNGQLVVTVEDDGKGFNPEILTQSKGIGWTNIQHRVDFLKGKLDVSSGPGKGTSVHIEFGV
jgi:two-component system NarL family sensor kinase